LTGLWFQARAKAAAIRIGELGERGGLEAGGVLAEGAPLAIQRVAVAQAVVCLVIDALAGVVDTAGLQVIVDSQAQAVVPTTQRPCCFATGPANCKPRPALRAVSR